MLAFNHKQSHNIICKRGKFTGVVHHLICACTAYIWRGAGISSGRRAVKPKPVCYFWLVNWTAEGPRQIARSCEHVQFIPITDFDEQHRQGSLEHFRGEVPSRGLSGQQEEKSLSESSTSWKSQTNCENLTILCNSWRTEFDQSHSIDTGTRGLRADPSRIQAAVVQKKSSRPKGDKRGVIKTYDFPPCSYCCPRGNFGICDDCQNRWAKHHHQQQRYRNRKKPDERRRTVTHCGEKSIQSLKTDSEEAFTSTSSHSSVQVPPWLEEFHNFELFKIKDCRMTCEMK